MWERREKKRERIRKEKDEVCMREREREREREIVILSLIKWVPHFSKYLQKCHWVMLFENWKLVGEVL